MDLRSRRRSFFSILFAAGAAATALSPAGFAQDGRGTVAEPTFPAVCTTIAAETTIANGEPVSETADTLIQPALTACTSGKAVELTLGPSGQNAFVIRPIAIPNGVTLIVDGGVTVFGSLVASDYQASGAADTCGVNGTNGDGCNALISIGQTAPGGKSSSTGSGLMGYGVIDGRGGDKPTVAGAQLTKSWWDLSNDARTGPNNSQNNPVLVQLYHAKSSVIYKITLINSPKFHVRNSGNSSNPGFTVWGLKLITPWNARNTDGVDPTGVTNMTVTNSVIGDGDDEIAISGSTASTGFTFSNLLLTSGHGISIGSITTNGVSNVLATNINFSGQASDSNQEAFRIKSYCGSGGLVSNVTYQNACVQNVRTVIDLNPTYSSTSSTTSCPSWQNITYKNIHVLSGGSSVNIGVRGLSATPSTLTFDNVVFDQLNSVNTGGAPQYTTITPAGPVYPQTLATLNTASGATGVSYTATPTVSNANALSCPTSGATNVFPALVGELYASTSTNNNVNQTVSLTNPASFTLNAMLEPANSQKTYTTASYGSYTGVPAPTAGIQFLDGATVVGTAALSANGTLASVTINNPTAGAHTYTANYVGDGTYSAMAFGPLTVNITAGPAAKLAFSTPPASAITYGNGPGTVTVVAQDVAGDTLTSLSGTVTLTVTGPNGYTATYTATASGGTATFSSIANPPVGTFTYTASQTSLTSATANESVTAATLTVTAQPASRIFGDPNPNFTSIITGYVNNDTSSVVSGAPVITSTATRTSPAGIYPISVVTGTLAAANYVFGTMSSTLTVTGGAPQSVLFAPLPNFPSGASYQLTARTTAGLPVTYTVNSGAPATVSGSTLTVNGPGLVTVSAANSGDSNYAAASSVSQTFTAQ